jgi:hypothetical protein
MPSTHSALDLTIKPVQNQTTVHRLTPKRIVAVGLVVVALSGIGFAVLEAMHPITPDENAAMVRIAIDRMNGVISDEERARRLDALDLGIFNRVVTRNAYRYYRVLLGGGALVGLMLVGIGAIRFVRSRTIVIPPSS